ncbi:hypothetical protein DRE_01328 [Drechslerella stenobrocha 248]|uniref:Uncharacterized protein n=1 Tax=Drechslerella stenobrocha 248 TaxID=1043628 RepID=W7HJ91_9PEZI|nr:hypothetical protein DRE_01328 [Drechslerella stenobrocha 248]
MDELVITLYPYAKSAVRQLTFAISHILKLLYPVLNSLYNANPNVVTIVLLVFVAYVLLRVVTGITNFIWSVTRSIIQWAVIVGVLATALNYYNKRVSSRVADDGTVIQGFDWDATWDDFQGVWGLVQNVGGLLMDLLESGSNLEDKNGFNSGRRNTVGKKGDGMFADAGRRRTGGSTGGAWQQAL